MSLSYFLKAIQRIAELEANLDKEACKLLDMEGRKHIAEQERNELAATVERLRKGVLHFNRSGGDMNPLLEAVSATDGQNLNAVKRQAFIEGAMTFRAFHSPYQIEKEANKKYPSDKE